MIKKHLQMEKWEEKRKQGKTKFIITTGVLGWGVTTGVLWAIAMFVFASGEKTLFKFISYFIGGIIGFPIGGYFYGLFIWNFSEKKYQEYTKNKML